MKRNRETCRYCFENTSVLEKPVISTKYDSMFCDIDCFNLYEIDQIKRRAEEMDDE